MAKRETKITDLEQLKLDPENARFHPEANRSKISNSLKRLGPGRSIVIDKNNVIRAGNGTVEEAIKLGGFKVKIVDAKPGELIAVRRKDWTDEEALAYAIADNASAEDAEWKPDVLADQLRFLNDEVDGIELEDVGFDLGGLEELEQGNEDPPEDPGAGDPPHDPVSERGKVYALGPHRLMCGDSTCKQDVANLLDGAKPNLMVTDPPYGVEYDPNWRNEAAATGALAYADRRVGEVENDDRAEWNEAWMLFPGSVFYCWHAHRHASDVQRSIEAAKFDIRSQVIWAKSNFPISRGHYHWRHEPCWYAVKKGRTARWCGDRKQTTLWEINLDKNVDGGHSTQKPLECMERPIRNHEGDVYDPFLGSGTTLIAAARQNRICYGMEISPAYCDVIRRRWGDYARANELDPGADAL